MQIKVDSELVLEKIYGLLQKMLHNSFTLLAQTIVSVTGSQVLGYVGSL